jgi:glycerol-3-phosphate dehydrogenase (NAD(P)+)
MNKPFAILGAGSWGTALALYLSRQGHAVRLWTAVTNHVAAMQKERENKRYHPGYTFPSLLHPTADLAEAIQDAANILIAVPSVGFRQVLTLLKPLLAPKARLISLSKGLDESTGQLLHSVFEEILGKQHAFAVLSGPSFSREVILGLPTAVVIASQDKVFAQDLLQQFNSPLFRIYLSSDVIGVEISGVVKNVLAIATGISDGMELGANARCALITRGLAEIMRLGLALGGKNETFMGLAGLGDLILTCTDDQSRNRRFGLSLGKGKTPSAAESEIGQVVEGKRNAELVVQLAKNAKVEMPIVEAVWKILQAKLTPQEAMQDLLSRAPKQIEN